MARILVVGTVLSAGLSIAASGCIKERCYHDTDCPADQVCGAIGVCEFACIEDEDCGEGFRCVAHRCRPKTPVEPVTCPDDMVVVADAYCVDRYEASRSDATSSSSGSDGSVARSRPGAKPWLTDDNAVAAAACEAAGKRLCTPAEWELACRGPADTIYAYGDEYEPETCNGIDTFGRTGFHLEPTGAFPGCTNEFGVYDMNGNAWEHVLGGDGRAVRGGAFNCSDSMTLHRCDYVPRTWTPSALGFRCCKNPDTTPVEPGPDAAITDVPTDVWPDAASENGCLPTDEGATDPGASDPSAADEGADDPGPAEDLPESDVGSDPGASQACPTEMAAVPWGDGNVTCIDRWEASRADATEDSVGSSPVATSRPGVLPWFVTQMNTAVRDTFAAACAASGKRLCTADEWFEACNGPDDTVYFFGNVWNRKTCNSVDTFCDDYCAANGISPCNLNENCGYEYYCFHVVPTGTFAGCTNDYGLFDVNGNVWEIVPSDSARGYEVRGGAFNCGGPSTRLKCTFDATWDGLYAGFRCCKDPVPVR